MLTREQMAMRAAREVGRGQNFRLGSGLSKLCEAHLTGGASAGTPAIAIIEAVEVSATGEIAFDAESASAAQSLDAAQNAPRVIVVMSHLGPEGQPRLRNQCQPPTAEGIRASRIITDLAVIDVTPEGLILREVANGISGADVQRQTEAPLLASASLQVIEVDASP